MDHSASDNQNQNLKQFFLQHDYSPHQKLPYADKSNSTEQEISSQECNPTLQTVTDKCYVSSETSQEEREFLNNNLHAEICSRVDQEGVVHGNPKNNFKHHHSKDSASAYVNCQSPTLSIQRLTEVTSNDYRENTTEQFFVSNNSSSDCCDTGGIVSPDYNKSSSSISCRINSRSNHSSSCRRPPSSECQRIPRITNGGAMVAATATLATPGIALQSVREPADMQQHQQQQQQHQQQYGSQVSK